MAPAFPLPWSAGDGNNAGGGRRVGRKSFSRPGASLSIDLDSSNSSGVGGEEEEGGRILVRSISCMDSISGRS